MRKMLLLICFLPIGCSSKRLIITDPAIVNAHPKPIKIFGIGYWKPGYMILTLTDAKNEYFVIKTQRNDSLKVGAIYEM